MASVCPSESIIRKHYLDLKSKDEAEQFWSILPKHWVPATVAPVVAIPPAPAALPVAV